MSFQGSIQTIGLAEVFQLFAFGAKTGALHLADGDVDAVVYFDAGDVCYAAIDAGEDFGAALERTGLVESSAWEALVAEAEPGACGDRLVADAAIDQDALRAVIRERVEDAIFKLVQWSDGQFRLADDIHPLGAAFRFPPAELLAEADRRLEQWREVTALIPSTQVGVRIAHELPAGDENAVLTREQWRLIAAFAPAASIADIAVSVGETELRTMQTMHGLVAGGLVEVVAVEVETSVAPVVDDAPARDIEDSEVETIPVVGVSLAALAAQAEAAVAASETEVAGEFYDEYEVDDDDDGYDERLHVVGEYDDTDSRVSERPDHPSYREPAPSTEDDPAAAADKDLDKSLILRMIAGVRSF